MAISLSKGQRVDLTKGHANLSKLAVGLGWDTNRYSGNAEFDLDASAFLLGAAGKVRNENDFVFYGQLRHPTGSVRSLGDNRTGEGEGDDEVIVVDLSKVPQDIAKIAFTVTIYDAEKRRQNFGQVSNSYIRVLDISNGVSSIDDINDDNKGEKLSGGTELLHYDLGEDFSMETAIVVGEIYRNAGEWKFSAIGSGFNGGLAALCGNYGVQVA